MLKDVMQTFQKLGLKENEAKVYLCCLHNRQGLFMHEIAKQTKIKRSSLYAVIDRLVEKKFISYSRSGQRKMYYAQTPDELLFEQEGLVETLKTLVPVLNKLGTFQDDTEVKFYEGIEGYKKVDEIVLLNLRTLPLEERLCYEISSEEYVLKLKPDNDSGFMKKRIKNRISLKHITTKGSRKCKSVGTDPDQLRETRYIDGPLKTSLAIFGDRIAICSEVKPVGAIVIQNRHIAVSMRVIFEALWVSLPEK